MSMEHYRAAQKAGKKDLQHGLHRNFLLKCLLWMLFWNI